MNSSRRRNLLDKINEKINVEGCGLSSKMVIQSFMKKGFHVVPNLQIYWILPKASLKLQIP